MIDLVETRRDVGLHNPFVVTRTGGDTGIEPSDLFGVNTLLLRPDLSDSVVVQAFQVHVRSPLCVAVRIRDPLPTPEEDG